MPPFVKTKCKHCNFINTFDTAEIKDKDSFSIKSITLRDITAPDEKEYKVDCQNCGKTIVISLPE